MTELPRGWVETTLEEIANKGRPICYGILMPKEHIADGVPYVRVKDFKTGQIDVSNLRRTAPSIAAKYQRSSLKYNDVLLAIRGTYGRVARVPEVLEGANVTQDSARIAPLPGISPRYIEEFLRSDDAQRYFARVARGVAVKGVNIGDLRQLRVPVAPTREQDRIVDALEEQLSRLDAAEESLHRARRNLDRFRGTVFLEVSSGDWPWTTLGAIAELAGGVTKDSKRQADPTFVEVPYLRVANVQRGHLDLSNVTTIRVSPEKAKSLALEPGDVLFNEGGDRDKLGRGWVWNGEIPGCIHQNHVFRARLDPAFDPRFVSWHGNTFGRGWFTANGRQTTNLASLNMSTLKMFPVPAPSLDEQLRIVAEVERQLTLIDAQAHAIDQALARSAALRRAILERAFTGRLVPQDPDDEPASVLLERIRSERPLPKNSRKRAGSAA